MPTVDIFDLTGVKTGELELSEEVFGAEVNEALLYEAVRQHQASLRSGTVKTKTRHEVAGSGKKLWKQKGTGRARVGSIRSPLWRHGGTVHGPQPHSHDYAFPKKKVLGALRAVLAAKLQDGKLTVVESLEMKEPKAKLYRAALNKLQAKRTVLLVESGKELSPSVVLGSRNLAGVEIGRAHV